MSFAHLNPGLPCKCVEHVRNDIVVQSHGRLITIDAPVRVVNAVPIHGLQRCGKGGLVIKWVDVVSAHCRSSSANFLACCTSGRPAGKGPYQSLKEQAGRVSEPLHYMLAEHNTNKIYVREEVGMGT